MDRQDEGETWERKRPRQEPEHQSTAVATNADYSHIQRVGHLLGLGLGSDPCADVLNVQWGSYAPAIERWEHVIGRSAPEPAIDRRLNPRFVEWMMGFDAGWVEGLTRNQALKALGNAVVPQQGEAAIRMLAT